jgi:hypothetical protein
MTFHDTVAGMILHTPTSLFGNRFSWPSNSTSVNFYEFFWLCCCLVGLETEGAIPSVHGGEAFENLTIFLYGCDLTAVVEAELRNGMADQPLALTFEMLSINHCWNIFIS